MYICFDFHENSMNVQMIPVKKWVFNSSFIASLIMVTMVGRLLLYHSVCHHYSFFSVLNMCPCN